MSWHEVVILDGGLKCDCGEVFPDLAALNEHSLVTYNNPQPHHIASRRASGYTGSYVKVERCADTTESVECQRVACWNKGNGRDCYSVIGTDAAGESVQWHELRHHEALLLRHHGGYVMLHKSLKLC